jgi:hypothetical protein
MARRNGYNTGSKNLFGRVPSTCSEDYGVFLAQLNEKNSAGFAILQGLATTWANAVDSAQVLPIVLAALYEQLSKFCIGTDDTEDLQVGLSPFLMCPVGYQ